MMGEFWPLVAVVIGVLILLMLIMWFKLNTFIALIITSMVTGILLGMPLDTIVTTIEKGMGDTLGHIAIIFGLGSILGKLLSDGGGATRIADTLINVFGKKYVTWAMIIASFIIGISLFLEVAFVLLIPLVFTLAKRMQISNLTVGLPMATSIAVTHGFLPPHPGPVAISEAVNANIGHVLMYGVIIGIPLAIIVGGIFPKIARKLTPEAFKRKGNQAAVGEFKVFENKDLPSFGMSLLTALAPVILMLLATIVQLITGNEEGKASGFEGFIYFIGTSVTAMLIAVLFAIYSMGIRRKQSMKQIMDTVSNAITPIAMLILIIGGGGTFKQILIDGGVGDTISEIFKGTEMSPLILAWLAAALLRTALGSTTVAAISSVGIVLPLLQSSDVNISLVVLAIGAGSIFCSHVNDAGFWMFKEYFGLTMKETFLTWTLLESILSIVGLGLILIVNFLV
ncbi:gluconate:H+ symporter [Staphylococcus sp. mip270_02]|uniref:Gluconate permease n=1 Tax=Staphylococcus xylosus TaxID=1288 RepID=A0A418IRL1_STAXY|nr:MULTISPECIES: gluconate:H+ symporter [Staphylococcus]MBF0814755.1 gluconate permease [Staphylococcus saprophyticus]MDW8543248.1 gluconate:H+ symporter [Staphylococcus sp. KG4-1]MDW8562668.1 gluconate:H+ symporter [Staphylococcus sp. KG4-3]PTI06645.1 gluconate permease [Staphylococcus xylosus]RIN12566.1 gluconate permease [Staphylococcus xylosus]